MQQIEAIVRPAAVDLITSKLTMAGILGCTALECKGFGKQKGHTERYRGGRMDVGFLPKVMLKLVVKDEDVSKVIELINAAARTGKVGDGKIFVSSVEQAIRIRTGEANNAAL